MGNLLHSSGLYDGEPLHEPAILLEGNFQKGPGGYRPLKAPGFETLVEKEKTVSLPEKSLEAVPASAAEEEERRLERGQGKCGRHNGGETVNGAAHICVPAGNKDMICAKGKFHEYYLRVQNYFDEGIVP